MASARPYDDTSNAALALSFWRPWPWTILHHPTHPKGIENRGHSRYSGYRGWLLLHAAQKWDDTCQGFVVDRDLGARGVPFASFLLSQRADHPTGIVGRCRVVGHVEPYALDTDATCRDGRRVRPQLTIGSGARCEKILQAPDRVVQVFDELGIGLSLSLDLRWWMGGYGLILTDPEPLEEPVACPGRPQLWRPSADTLAKLPAGWDKRNTA